jgi:hypothetical protein
MRTEKQKAASRANGRRSRGPKTPEGKATSALNNLRHGLLAKCVVLPHENHDNFQIYLDQHAERFQVADQVEMNVVEDMVSAAWRLRRNVDMQTTMLEREMANYDSPFAVDNLVAAFNKLAGEPGLRLLLRYENSLHRQYYRCLSALTHLQKTRPEPEEMGLPNEPETTLPNEPELELPNEPEEALTPAVPTYSSEVSQPDDSLAPSERSEPVSPATGHWPLAPESGPHV